jgi:CheY-like chemotaxis protein
VPAAIELPEPGARNLRRKLARERRRRGRVLASRHDQGFTGNALQHRRKVQGRKREAGAGGKHTPIIALTASVLPEERARCKEVGMDDYIAKPFSSRDLQQVLARYL